MPCFTLSLFTLCSHVIAASVANLVQHARSKPDRLLFKGDSISNLFASAAIS